MQWTTERNRDLRELEDQLKEGLQVMGCLEVILGKRGASDPGWGLGPALPYSFQVPNLWALLIPKLSSNALGSQQAGNISGLWGVPGSCQEVTTTARPTLLGNLSIQ